MNILIAEDHTLTARLLAGILEKKHGLTIVGIVSDGIKAVRAVNEFLPDICLFDISMPYMDGIKALKEIKSTHPNIKIIMLSGHSEKWIIEKTISYGASGYLTKHVEPAEILAAIMSVSSGEYYFDKISSEILELKTSNKFEGLLIN